jgi:ribosomal protein S18 acetylase RimI-like enzyme
MKVDIRQAKIEDAADIARVQVETWQQAYKFLLPDDYLQSLSVEKKTEGWKNGLADPYKEQKAFVITLDDQIVGFNSIGPNRDADISDEVGELCALYIHPLFQKKGFGKQLSDYSLTTLDDWGYSKATLWVLTSNLAAQSFYQSQGWQKEGSVQEEYKDGIELHQTRYIINIGENLLQNS